MSLSNLSPSSKIWVYKSSRELNSSEQDIIRKELDIFIPQWASHGNKLFGGAEVVENWFVILAVDETQSMASGCSIDTSVQFMKALGKELNVDFFNRMQVLIENEGQKEQVHFSEIGNFPNAKLYNPMIGNLNELNTNWLIPVKESQFA